MTISNFSTTASNNTSINGVSIAEGMSPSDVNNALREYSKDLRTVWNDKEWFLLGSGNQTVTYTRASATSVTINADVSSTYHVGRRVKVVGTATGTLYGKIATSSYSSPNTTVTFTFDSGSINSGDTTVSVFVGSVFNNPSVPVIDTDAMTEDSAILPPSQQSVKAFVESGSITMTNKTLTSPTLTSPVLNTSLSGTAFKDEDDMSSDSATAVASQQSIKAYVDSQVTAQDLDITTDSGSIAIDLDSETLTVTGGTGIDSSATGNTLTLAIDSTVVTESSTDTLTNKTISGSSNTLSNIANSSLTNSSITVTDGSNSTATALGGTITYAAGEGLDVAESSGTITYSGEDATTSNKGVASFSSSNFDVTSGAVSIKTAGVGNTAVATGIAATKIADGSVTDTEFQYIGGLTSDAQTQLTSKLTASNNLSDVSSASTSRTNLGLGTISTQASNNVSITGGAISGLSLPTADTEASSKLYVDNAIAGMRTRIITKVATTGNVNLTNGLENGDSIDGITLQTGDKILVKSQTDATENGIYICPSSGTASRDTNYDTVEELAGQMIVVQQGSTNADKIFLCTTDNSGSIGSVDIVFSQVTPANQGTVQSVAVADAGSSEFTITGSPITSSGTINLAVNSINATKIGSGNVDNTELGYLNGVTSNIQTQLDNSASLGDAISFAVALGS
jgi:hypothetical protein